MEENKFLEFQIITGDDKIIKEIIINYNKFYKTNFEIIEFMYDEVVFAKIRVSIYKISDIFNLGSQYGGYIQFKREKREIDW